MFVLLDEKHGSEGKLMMIGEETDVEKVRDQKGDEGGGDDELRILGVMEEDIPKKGEIKIGKKAKGMEEETEDKVLVVEVEKEEENSKSVEITGSGWICSDGDKDGFEKDLMSKGIDVEDVRKLKGDVVEEMSALKYSNSKMLKQQETKIEDGPRNMDVEEKLLAPVLEVQSSAQVLNNGGGSAELNSGVVEDIKPTSSSESSAVVKDMKTTSESSAGVEDIKATSENRAVVVVEDIKLISNSKRTTSVEDSEGSASVKKDITTESSVVMEDNMAATSESMSVTGVKDNKATYDTENELGFKMEEMPQRVGVERKKLRFWAKVGSITGVVAVVAASFSYATSKC